MNTVIRYTGCVVLLLGLFPPVSAAGGGGHHFQHLVRPHTAYDFNPDPDIVEVVLNARQEVVDFGTGNKTAVWTYNGTIPGPTIESDVGDTVIVHFFNSLPEETTIHWHGVELPANMDGSNISQLAVPSGGYFRYEFQVHRPAMYWYHPHIRSNVQVEQGLYGTLMVHDPDQDRAFNLPRREHYLVLDDVLLNDNGQIAQPFPDDPLENAVMHANGREGNTLLVNGRTDRKAYLKRGKPQRLRVVNVSNTRFMRLSIPTDTVWRIGGDGGLLEHPLKVEPIQQVPDPEEPGETISDPDPSVGVLLSPGERADLVFTPKGRDDLALEWHDIARGRHSASYNDDGSIALGHVHEDGHLPPQDMMTFKLYGWDKHKSAYEPPENLRDITPIDTTGAETIRLTFGHTPPDENGDITFFVQTKDGMPLPFDQVTPEDAPVVSPGDTRIIEIHNLTGGAHNFHLHGFMFQVLGRRFIDEQTGLKRFEPNTVLEDKDTAWLPERPGGMGTSRTIMYLAVNFYDDNRQGQVFASGKQPTADTSGGWVMHCHILEHVDNGMMSFVQVVE